MSMSPDYYIEGIPVYVMLMDPDQANFPAYPMDPNFITVHETENHDEGANALVHGNYLLNGAGGREASWHFTVDDHCIVQSAKLNQNCWHAGDGDGNGNTASIGIETCENSDGDFNKAVQNVQALVRYLKGETSISTNHIKQHHFWSGKNCPSNLIPVWDDFIRGIDDSRVKPRPVTPKKPAYSNNSIVDYLKSIGKDYSFEARKEYAEDYHISNYKGTAAQNLELLDKMREGGPSRKSEPSGYKGNSIVDYLKSIDQSASFTNRSRLANEYGISGYRGTAEQNLLLLNRMRKGIKNVPYPGHYIKEGSKGRYVKMVQGKVNVKEDGIFGPITERAVRDWQRDHGLSADGIVGPKTWSKMF